jgi:CheY-like chemotaxis protein
VVEDEDLVREAAAQILNEAGYRVLQAKTAAQALGHEAHLLRQVSLLFTDVVLPDQGGRELAMAFLKLRPAIKVIFTSGYPEKLVIRKSVKGSFYLQKAFLWRESQRPCGSSAARKSLLRSRRLLTFMVTCPTNPGRISGIVSAIE